MASTDHKISIIKHFRRSKYDGKHRGELPLGERFLDTVQLWRLRKYRAGICAHCLEPRLKSSVLCASCLLKNRERTRKRKNLRSWYETRRGTIPTEIKYEQTPTDH